MARVKGAQESAQDSARDSADSQPEADEAEIQAPESAREEVIATSASEEASDAHDTSNASDAFELVPPSSAKIQTPVSAHPTSTNPVSASPSSAAVQSASAPSAPTSSSALPISAAKISAPRSRPEAPALQFSVGGNAEQLVTCPSCRSTNPPGYRFCVTCGAAIGPGRPGTPGQTSTAVAPAAVEAAPVKVPAAAPSPLPVPVPAMPVPVPDAAPMQVTSSFSVGDGGDKIIGAPVVSIATAQAPAPKLIRCSRCHGHSAEGMRFCKYCGAPLDDALAQQRTDMDAQTTETFVARASDRSAQRTERVGVGFVQKAVSEAPVATNQTPKGRLVVIVEDGSEGKSFPLEDRQIDVGRTEGDILLADDHYVSPRHARLVPEAGRWLVRDLCSTNGIYRRIREPHTLKDGDLLLLGLEVLQFETVNDAERGLGHASQHGTLLFGSPSTPRRARLCQRTVEGVVRDVYHLFRDETVIGREVGDIVFTSDPFLSRRHATIRRSPGSGEFAITDLDSSNGTYVAIRSDRTLVNGDYLRIGQHLFRVDLG